MKKLLPVIFLILLSSGLWAQPDRIGVGLDFSTGLYINKQKTGNPGLVVKTWLKLDKKHNVFLVPSVAAFNPYIFSDGINRIENYMFQGDLDGQFRIYEEKTLKVIGFAGMNFLWLVSDVTPGISTFILTDKQDMALGGNAGLGLEMRMSSYFDFNLFGKYTISKSLSGTDMYKQAIITVQAVYYFRERRKGSWY